MSNSPQFLVIDFHPESRFLLVKTLARKFPGAVIHETEDAEKAVEIVRAIDLIAVITHRTFDVSGVDLVRQLRNADPDVPIVMVSGIDREEAALAAGANAFLNYDEWLRIGAVVETVLAKQPRPPRARLGCRIGGGDLVNPEAGGGYFSFAATGESPGRMPVSDRVFTSSALR